MKREEGLPMNADLMSFNFDGAAVRVQVDDVGQPWFNAGDVCAVLELG